jgi:hypothetical protein
MMLQEQKRGGHMKIGLREASLGARAPRGTAMAYFTHADSIDGEKDSARVCSGIFPP